MLIAVSILTDPEGPVKQKMVGVLESVEKFQSSPIRKDR